MDINFFKFLAEFFPEFFDDLEGLKVLVFLDDNILIFLIKNTHGLLLVAAEEIVYGVNGELHL